ncbi:MAG: hypothetical protein IAF38_23065 [Bacteroidia bacterium]|nr:hypothetical protein [Bacteroidia bacterium]
MKKQFAFILGSFLAGSIFYSCCKDPGFDGGATVVIHLKHHGTLIPNQTSYPDSVFVKAGAEESPGISAGNYDKVFVGEGTSDHVHLQGLKCGKYFIFCTGKDNNGNFRVTGGQGVVIKHKERKKEIEIDIAVTE